jgi:hypothetical protein
MVNLSPMDRFRGPKCSNSRTRMLARWGVIEGTTEPMQLEVTGELPRRLKEPDRFNEKLKRDQRKLLTMVPYANHEGLRLSSRKLIASSGSGKLCQVSFVDTLVAAGLFRGDRTLATSRCSSIRPGTCVSIAMSFSLCWLWTIGSKIG